MRIPLVVLYNDLVRNNDSNSFIQAFNDHQLRTWQYKVSRFEECIPNMGSRANVLGRLNKFKDCSLTGIGRKDWAAPG